MTGWTEGLTRRRQVARAASHGWLLVLASVAAFSSGAPVPSPAATLSATRGAQADSAWKGDPRKAAALGRIDRLRLATHARLALGVIDSCLLRAAADRDTAYLLQLLLRKGELHTSVGSAAGGQNILDQALRISRARRDTTSMMVAIRWLSVACGSLGRPAQAEALAHELLRLARGQGNRRLEGWALVGLGNGAWMRARYDQSWDRFRTAASIFQDLGDGPAEAWARNGLGMALEDGGDHAGARAAFRDAILLARASGYFVVEGLAANNLGTLEHELGDPGAALEWFREALAVHRRFSSPREAIIPSLNAALCERELGRLDAASDSLDRMLAECRRSGWRDLEARLLLECGDLRMDQHRPGAAERFYKDAIRLGNAATEHLRVQAATGLAESMTARDSAEAAVAILEPMLRGISGLKAPALKARLEVALGRCLLAADHPASAQMAFARAQRGAESVGMDVIRLPALIGSARACILLGEPEQARRTLERACSLWESSRGAPRDLEWREVRGAAGHEICTDLAGLLLGREPCRDPAKNALAYERAERFKTRTLLERMGRPESSIGPTDPVGPMPGQGPDVAFNLAQFQQEALEPGELVLEFFLGPSRSLLFAVRRDSVRAIPLAAEGILEPPVRLVRGLLASPPEPETPATEEALRRGAAALRDLLFPGAEEWIGQSDRVIVAADGFLNLLPFASLFDPALLVGRPDAGATAASTGRSDRTAQEWVQVPSASVWLRIRQETRAAGGPPSRDLLVLGPAGGPLEGARVEAAAIARTYHDARLRLLGERDTVRPDDLAGNRLVLHLAGHAAVEDERPWRSRVALGSRGLTAAEIAGARVPARLAVLTGCETAGGRIVSGEGTLGLSSAFLCAGTRCVVASLWPIDDRAAARLALEFYARLASGRTVATALREAQQRLRDREETRSPYYWAGFITIGAGQERVPLRVRDRGARSAGAAVAATSSAALGLWALRAWSRSRAESKGRAKADVIFPRSKRPMG